MKTEELSSQIYRVAKKAFLSHQPASAVGYSIQSHDTADSISLVLLEENSLSDDLEASLFNIEEWSTFLESPELDALNSVIVSIYNEMDDYENSPDWHHEFRELVFSSSLKALKELREDLKEEGKNSSPYLMFWVAGSKLSEKEGKNWCAELNGEEFGARFAAWQENESAKLKKLLDEFERTGNIET